MTYDFISSPFAPVPAMLKRDDNGVVAFVPLDLENVDYQAFLAWMAEGNPTPEGWTGPSNP